MGSRARRGKGAARALALALDAATEQHHSNYSNDVSAEQWEKYMLQKVYNDAICCWQNSLKNPRMMHFLKVICTHLTSTKLAKGSAGRAGARWAAKQQGFLVKTAFLFIWLYTSFT